MSSINLLFTTFPKGQRVAAKITHVLSSAYIYYTKEGLINPTQLKIGMTHPVSHTVVNGLRNISPSLSLISSPEAISLKLNVVVICCFHSESKISVLKNY